jgi:hypothetical protein
MSASPSSPFARPLPPSAHSPPPLVSPFAPFVSSPPSPIQLQYEVWEDGWTYVALLFFLLLLSIACWRVLRVFASSSRMCMVA